ncbi:hypothetical protein LTR93_012314, partial [Exophiala xenobiotica]
MATADIHGISTFRLEDGILVQSDPDTTASPPTEPSTTQESDTVTPIGIESNIVDTVQLAYGFPPKPCQLKSLDSIITQQRDTILYAPTGVGKSLIQQVFPLICSGWVLCIIPISRLGEDQVEKIASLPNVHGFLLHEKTNTGEHRRKLRAALADGGCTH